MKVDAVARTSVLLMGVTAHDTKMHLSARVTEV
jgi:hypothetical protein